MTANGTSFSFRLQRAREGTQRDVSSLLEAYRNYLRFLGYDGVAGALRAKVDASDIAQEVLIRAQQRFGQFHGQTEAELLAWLGTILAREIVDYARRHGGAVQERAVTEILCDSSASLARLGGLAHTTPSQHAARKEVAVVLADALATLTPDQQQAILLRTREGLSWDEVGQRMGRTADAVRQLWVRGLRALRPLLEERL